MWGLKNQTLQSWKPVVSLDEGMEKTADWLKDQGFLSKNKKDLY